MALAFLYTTIDDSKKAKKIAKRLLEDKLAACINIIPKVESYYHYKGKLEHSEELIVLIKTEKKLIPWLRSKLEKKHPYDCPCLIEIPITSANKLYEDWVLREIDPK